MNTFLLAAIVMSSAWCASLAFGAEPKVIEPAPFMDTETVLQLADKPEMQALGQEVQTLLKRACASLKI